MTRHLYALHNAFLDAAADDLPDECERWTLKALAEEFNTKPTTVSAAVNGQSWRHLTEQVAS
jgi:hypothetical protein